MISPYFLSTAVVVLRYLAAPVWAEFNPNGTQNLFVYFSQSSGINASLNELCSNVAVDVVIIGFVRSFTDTAGYPTVDFGPSNCNGTRPADSELAPGLAVCKEFGQKIKKCQEMGKKVFISIGGSTSNTAFGPGSEGRTKAKKAAKLMWDLFGEGTGTRTLRPFGRDVTVDGFDIDHEQGASDNFDVFLSSLRNYLGSASKPIYISAAPICTTTNPTISRASLAFVDFIFIRFYNSAACSLGRPGFLQSLKEWYQGIVPSPDSSFPKVLIGGLSFDNGNTGYVAPEIFRDAIRIAKRPDFMCWCWNEDKFGGAMLWDGPRGLTNEVANGTNYLSSVKNALLEA
ncbi:glycoside hydrolase [Massarina eburnea CBS 473.64]|uniref:chitinase n=1 Tax=Massarina eburnea CBS 473.64 TaxID=1395130 RepID=A0A6A6S6B2_9PLEO|nr:glycoside hydrolase [Massarina eburnea CBS 473.64]